MKTLPHLFLVVISVIAVISCHRPFPESEVWLLRSENFDTIIQGKEVNLFTLRNDQGAVAQFTNLGGRWLSMWVPDKNGVMRDVVLGFNRIDEYLSAGEPYHGAITGRVCGRINNGSFSLNGKYFKLANNDGFGKPLKNHLHGGDKGFHLQVWDTRTIKNSDDESGLVFSYLSEDGEEGYPGNLEVEVSYLLSNDNEMIISYRAVSDQPTVVNITNHAFFNLNGEGNGNIMNHWMKIFADQYIECDEELIPTGSLLPVTGTPLDFSEFTPMGKGIDQKHDQIFTGKGYAAAMVINEMANLEMPKIAEAYSELSGIKMDVFTNQPSLQIYNAWLFDGCDTGKQGKPYHIWGGFVMETQKFPDAVNHHNFPSVALNPDEIYDHRTIYQFSVNKPF